jgi:exosortase/archaeosortase family protein
MTYIIHYLCIADAAVVTWLLHLCGFEATRHGARIVCEGHWSTVAPACVGAVSLFVTMSFAFALAPRADRATVLAFFCAIPIAFFSNCLRIFFSTLDYSAHAWNSYPLMACNFLLMLLICRRLRHAR